MNGGLPGSWLSAHSISPSSAKSQSDVKAPSFERPNDAGINFYREKTQGLTVYRSLFNMVEGQVPHEEQDAKSSDLQRDRFHYHYESS